MHKRLLIYLHLHFKGDTNEILKELLERNLKFTKEEFEEKLKSVDENAYTTFFDDEYPEEWKSDVVGSHPLVIEKN